MICTENIDNLIPDSILDSGHFHFVILDVEGRVLRRNRSFENFNPNSLGKEFWKFLSVDTAEEFCYSLELMLGSPKIRRHLMLEHPSAREGQFSQIWWEFSVVTNPEMDISAVIGIGVGLPLLEQEMPWNNLVDVLGFGKITLDRNFRILSWDERINSWFSQSAKNWNLKALTQTADFGDETTILEGLHAVLDNSKPYCLALEGKGDKESNFAGLLTPALEGYHFFLVPKEEQISKTQDQKIFSDRDLNLIQGAIFVLDKEGVLIQQNEYAQNFGLLSFGQEFMVGSSMRFDHSRQNFFKFVQAIEKGIKGLASQFEQSLVVSKNEFYFWEVSVRPIHNFRGDLKGVVLHLMDITSFKKQIFNLHQENARLKDLANQPSHILRGPLSSMMGIIELIDTREFSEENKKLFSYLKPLAEEIDQKIRSHSKKIGSLDQ